MQQDSFDGAFMFIRQDKHFLISMKPGATAVYTNGRCISNGTVHDALQAIRDNLWRSRYTMHDGDTVTVRFSNDAAGKDSRQIAADQAALCNMLRAEASTRRFKLDIKTIFHIIG